MEDRTTKLVVDVLTGCLNVSDSLDELKNLEPKWFSQQLKNHSNKFIKVLESRIKSDLDTLAVGKGESDQLANNIDVRNNLLKVISKLDLPMMERLIVYADELLYNDENVKEEQIEEVKDENFVNPLEAELNNVKNNMGVYDTKKIFIPLSDIDKIPMDESIKDEQERHSKFRAAIVEYGRNMCGDKNSNASDWQFVDFKNDTSAGNVIIEFKKES